jgi:ornithine cyclodeaminase
MDIRVLSAEDVSLALPMREAVSAMGRVFAQMADGRATMPLRGRIATDKGVTLLMPAFLHTSRQLGIKAISIYDDNPALGLPTVNALALVLDPDTGLPRALIEGNSLTALRTGAAGGLGADLLARSDARTVALIGTGVQGRAQLQAVLAVRDIEDVLLFNRSPDRARILAREVAGWESPPRVRVCSSPREAVQDADIVIAATNSMTPVFDGRDLKPGSHVTGVGSFKPEMQEVDRVTVQRSRIFVDSREACLEEAGELIANQAPIEAELGQVINGQNPGRHNNDEITFFKSVGVAAQDAAAAAEVLSRAEELGLGTLIRW